MIRHLYPTPGSYAPGSDLSFSPSSDGSEARASALTSEPARLDPEARAALARADSNRKEPREVTSEPRAIIPESESPFKGVLDSILENERRTVRLSRLCSCQHPDGAHDAGGCTVRVGLYELDGSFRQTDWCGCTKTRGFTRERPKALARSFATGRIWTGPVQVNDGSAFCLAPMSCALCTVEVKGDAVGGFSPIDGKWIVTHPFCARDASENGGVAERLSTFELHEYGLCQNDQTGTCPYCERVEE